MQSDIKKIGYSNRRDIFFDVRYSGGKFAPPFLPGTMRDLIDVPGENEIKITLIDDAGLPA